MLFSLLLFLAEVLSFYCPAIHTYITSRCTGRTGKRILGKQKAPISACFTHKVFKKRQFYTALLLEQKEVALNHIPQPPRSPSTLTCGLPAPPPRCRLWGADTRGSTVQVFLWLAPRAVGTEGNIPKGGGGVTQSFTPQPNARQPGITRGHSTHRCFCPEHLLVGKSGFQE